MSYLKAFVSAILAGISIGFGGLVFLSVDNKVIGAALFTIGLFCICTFGFNLFTGKVCYAMQNRKEYAMKLPVIWLGNLVGTGLAAVCVLLTRNAAALSDKAMSICQIKTNDSYVSLFFLGLLCNTFIYIAVEGFKNNIHETGKYLSLFFGVMAFVLSGTEHCVADMFYFWMAKDWSFRSIVSLFVITAGNIIGGIAVATLHKSIKQIEK